MDNENALDVLLSVAAAELESINNKNPSNEKTTQPGDKNESLIHDGDTDSSEDESKRNLEEARYSQYGKQVKDLLAHNAQERPIRHDDGPAGKTSSWLTRPSRTAPSTSRTADDTKQDVYTDPVFGLRIVNPLISSAVLRERMAGREAVTFARLAAFLKTKHTEKDWVLAGVLTFKSAVKTSQKGSQFIIWTLSDLKDDIKTVTLFLFSSAYHQLWKTAVGTVVGILNPNVLDKKDGSRDVATLSVDNPQRVMIFGTSKDLGTCRSVKKSGEKCNAIVNTHRCEFCLYHIKQEYQKCSQRSVLQSSFVGRGLTALRNKVLGKNEVFYAGKSYTAIPAKKSKKLERKDNERLQSLNGVFQAKVNRKSTKKRKAAVLEVSHAQRLRDMEILKKLVSTDGIEQKNSFVNVHSSEVSPETSKRATIDVINKLKKKNQEQTKEINAKSLNNSHSSEVTLEESKIASLNVINKLKQKGQTKTEETNINNHENETIALKTNDPTSSTEKNISIGTTSKSIPSFGMKVPTLSRFDAIELSTVNRPLNKAKRSAIRYIQEKGPIEKLDPNDTKGKKRPALAVEDPPAKKGKLTDEVISNKFKSSKSEDNDLTSDRLQKIMAATSKHANLIEARDDEAMEKYYAKLEKKEDMEEKMTNTYKVACKAVRCLTCKYTSFSAADRCKEEKHPLKVFDAMKRFFKCGDCGFRTVSLDIVPRMVCKNCGSGKWERTGMMKEKIVTGSHSLSIRGGEQVFVNSAITNANVNLLVPDD